MFYLCLVLQVVISWTVVDLGARGSGTGALGLLLLRLMWVTVLLLLVETMDGVAFLLVAIPFLRHSAQF